MSGDKNLGIALVTGCSSGIGAAFAKALAARGYDLIVVARRRERLEALADSLRRDKGIAVEVLVADLSEPAGLSRVEERVAAEERLTMLVNNAGLGGIMPFLKMDRAYLQAMIAVNVTAVTLLTYAALPGMLRRARGTIVNVSSGLAYVRMPGIAVYGPTKAFVAHFTQTLHLEYGAQGIRFQALLPGLTRTELGSGLDTIPMADLPPERFNTPERVAETSLAGLELGELVCIPGLANLEEWREADSTMQRVLGGVSPATPAERYRPLMRVP